MYWNRNFRVLWQWPEIEQRAIFREVFHANGLAVRIRIMRQ